jgi:hypothetical protein
MIMEILQVLLAAREKFTQEISFRSKDKDISLAKVILFFLSYFKSIKHQPLFDEAYEMRL